MLRLRTFGGLALTSDAQPITGAAGQRRPLALLAVLAVAGAHPTSRERLQALLWPESDEVRARRVLTQTLYALRRDLGDPVVILGTVDLRLNPDLITSDVAEFEHALAVGTHERAVVLYEGPFLEGVHLAEAPEFERWAEDERARLAHGAHRALERLARAAAQAGDAEVAAGWWRRLAVLDPLDARAAVGLMEALVAAGDTAGALRHARVHEALFREELDAPADPAVAALVERLRTPPRSVASISRDAAAIQTAPAAPPTTQAPGVPHVPAGDAAGEAAAAHLRAPEPVPRVNGSGPASVAGDRLMPVLPDADAGAVAATAAVGRAAPRRTGVWRLLTLGVVAVIVGTLLLLRVIGGRPPKAALDDELVLVVPFDAADPTLQVWREGLMDVLARNLDGAGPLRTVSPTVVARQWTGRADREAVAAFARGLRAGTAIYGGLVPAGPDSVRASITLLDVRSGLPVLELSRHEALARMDRLSDSLTIALVRGLASRVGLGAVQRVPLGGGTSTGALRPFLRGEQFFRRAVWDSAIAYYEQAVESDPAFALAHRRLGVVLGWQGLAIDSLAEAHLLQAGALNRGLGPRDSLLVAADSQSAAANAAATAIEQWPFARRLFATLAVAARTYPTDPEVWYEIGEARYHFGAGPVLRAGSSRREILDAFDRAIALDSAFGPAYAHTPQLALDLGGPALALRYVNRYQAIAPADAATSGARVLQALLVPPGIASPRVRQLIDTLSPGVLYAVRNSVRRWPDSAETAVQLARVLAWGGSRGPGRPLFRDSAFRARILAEQLAYRGHVREAERVIGAQPVGIGVELAYLGGAPADSFAARLARFQASESSVATQALGWWAARGDTVALRRHVDLARARLAGAEAGASARRLGAVYDTSAALAHLVLARHDSAEALRRFETLPDTLCPRCYPDRLTRARLLSARGRHRDAMAALREPLVALLSPFELLFALERGRVAERLGDRQEARESYAFVAASWARGDPEVQPYVAAARAGLQRVGRR